MTTFHCQAELVLGQSEGGPSTSYATLSAHSLREVFDKLLNQASVDFGTVTPDALTIIISKE